MIGRCQAEALFRRSSFTDGVIDTGKSFKSWDTCMHNKACKIIAIVGIVIASIVAVWLIGGLLSCFTRGVSGIGEFCCWCCNLCNKNPNEPNGYGNQNFNTVPNGKFVGSPPDVVYQPIHMPERAYNKFDAYAEYDPRKNSSKNTVYDESIELNDRHDLESQNLQGRSRKQTHLSPQRMPLTMETERFDGRDELSVYGGYHHRGQSTSDVSDISYEMEPFPPAQQSPSRRQHLSTNYNSSSNLVSGGRGSRSSHTSPVRQPVRAPYPADNDSYYEENVYRNNRY